MKCYRSRTCVNCRLSHRLRCGESPVQQILQMPVGISGPYRCSARTGPPTLRFIVDIRAYCRLTCPLTIAKPHTTAKEPFPPADEVHITLQLPAIRVDKWHSPNFCFHHFGQGGLWALKCGRTRLVPALWKVVCSFCFLWSEGIIFSILDINHVPVGDPLAPGER